MRNHALRMTLAVTAFLWIVQWSRPAAADVTVTGTVGTINVQSQPNRNFIFFNFTDPNQTKGCFSVNTQLANYAQICAGGVGINNSCNAAGNQNGSNPNVLFREIYAQLLVSKKGATITCTLYDKTDCYVSGCTLN